MKMSKAKQKRDGNPEHSVVLCRTDDESQPEIPARSQSADSLARLRARVMRARDDAKRWSRRYAKRKHKAGHELYYREAVAYDRVMQWIDALNLLSQQAQVEQEAITPPAD